MKPKVAFYWCASCGGCEEAVVDLAERLLDVAAAVEIVMWPVAIDAKRADVETLPDRAIFASFVNGAIRTTEQEEMVRLLRRKSQVVVAFGSCAHMGGIPGLANLWDRETIFRSVYLEAPTVENPEEVIPVTEWRHDGQTLHLPGFYDTVRALDQVVDVDYVIPGCAPTPDIVASAVTALLSDGPPAPGTVLAPDVGLCDACDRRETKPDAVSIEAFRRPHEVLVDDELCLLAQGLLCLGPATRAGCGSLCVNANMPCTGCFGPTSRVRDQGAKALSAIASIIGSNDPEEIDGALEGVPDPIGTFYRYGLPASLLVRRKLADRAETTV